MTTQAQNPLDRPVHEPPSLEQPRPALPPLDLATVPWLAVGIFALLACGLAWLVQVPTWLTGGMASPWFLPMTIVMMATPAIAALIVTFFVLRPSHRARFLGLTPFRPVWRSILVILLAPAAWLVLAMAALLLAQALGWVELDWAMHGAAATFPAGLDASAVLLITLLGLPINTLISAVPAFGEELGWRGFLQSALSPLGFWRMALLSGVLWGVWHAPVILLGYNFARPDLLGVLCMVAFCLVAGVLLSWLRAVCHNVWVAAVAHGAINTVTGVTLVFLPAGSDVLWTTVLGVPGWIVLGLVIAAMAAFGLCSARRLGALIPAPQVRQTAQAS
ncbi:CPBP family intramembrane glutamic endopeptidase [Agrococcus sp. ARC_14]|uniref:CPBP family intramembrane glutamic endopeptidase n=1 Tax=Agrococcus sp. ARC_14 TaxID=2919927 RepID=UPI001F06D6DC|nr:CPBP family intramembrane glutamic endopeptidase [Agrococcus sp. ARC_14]MCH1881712.1 CPBP family intramembrane metalloprotease [Agrococcus sp. ARC_14]